MQHTIQSLKSRSIDYQFCQQLGIPIQLLDQFSILEVDLAHQEVYSSHYELILKYHPKFIGQLSLVDFMLAYVAAENLFSILSQDHHLEQIRRVRIDTIEQTSQYFLNYDLVTLDNLPHIPGDAFILLDTNILLSFIDPSSLMQKFKKKFEKVVLKTAYITYLIPDFVITEAQKVYKTKYASIALENELKAEVMDYVEDFEGFHKKPRQAKNPSSSTNSLVSKKFQHLLDD
jgi:hypothetical protein